MSSRPRLAPYLNKRCASDWDAVFFNLGKIIVPHMENPLDGCAVNKAFTVHVFAFMRKTFPPLIRGTNEDLWIDAAEGAELKLRDEPFVRALVAAINGGAIYRLNYFKVRVQNVALLSLLGDLGGDAFPRLETLDFCHNYFGDAAAARLFSSLATAYGSGALPRLETLNLKLNEIGDAGMQALAAACGSRAIPQLKTLYLEQNKIGDAGMQAFATAIGNGAMANLTTLIFWDNKIRDEGMKAFAAAVGSRAMAKLTELRLAKNKIGDAGMQAFAMACGSGALPNLVDLSVYDNPASEASKQAASDAIRPKRSTVDIAVAIAALKALKDIVASI